jgi:hypothetical protein
MGETIEIKIGKKCKAIIIDHALSNIQAKFWKCNTKQGIFELLGTMQMSDKHSLEIIIIIVTSFWQGHMREWKIFLVENIYRKAKNLDENDDDEKKGRKKKCHVRKYNTKIKMRKKTSLLELST